MNSAIIPDHLLQHATPAELDQYEKALKAELALTSPLEYALFVSDDIAKDYPHSRLLDNWIMALMEGRLYIDGPGPQGIQHDDKLWYHPLRGDRVLYQLAISMPPQHGKSFLVSEHLPAWFLTKYPDMLVMLASYEADFAASWGLKALRHVQDNAETFDVAVDPATRSGGRWNIDKKRGGMITAGAGGPLTGKGGHLKIIDDPIKNNEDALSATQRQNTDNWYQSTFRTRSRAFPDGSPARTILMNTRWHEDDLTGRVLAREPTKWATLNLPALAEPTEGVPDPLGRAAGEPLCPELHSLEKLQDDRDGADKYWWAAMYQGRPNIEGGGIIHKPFRYHRLILPPNGGPGSYESTDFQGQVSYHKETECFRFATVDMAGSVKTSADFTVYSVWDVTQAGLMFLHAMHRLRMESPDHEAQILAWQALYPRTKVVGIENKTFGTQVIKGLVRHASFAIRPLEADIDKVSRAIPYGDMIATGRISFPIDAPWLDEWEHEHLQFPNGTHDDMVDTGAYAAIMLADMPSRKPRKPEPETYDERVEAFAQRRFGKGRKRQRARHPDMGLI